MAFLQLIYKRLIGLSLVDCQEQDLGACFTGTFGANRFFVRGVLALLAVLID